MGEALPTLYLARHGETAWSLSGQHTGHTDLPLTERGERNAASLGKVLHGNNVLCGHAFSRVFTSPLQRARRTCELAGYGAMAGVDPDLTEWNYGQYEGLTTAEIRRQRPDWDLFRDGCPGGESIAEVTARAERVIERVRRIGEDVLLFSSGHFLRVLTVRWLGLDTIHGRYLYLSTATLSKLGYDHSISEPVIRLWNDDRHVCET